MEHWRQQEHRRVGLGGVNRFGLAFVIGDGKVIVVTKESITVETPEWELKGQQYEPERCKFWRRGREYFS